MLEKFLGLEGDRSSLRTLFGGLTMNFTNFIKVPTNLKATSVMLFSQAVSNIGAAREEVHENKNA